MATSLAEQLNRLKTPQSSLLVHKKLRPSFLFDQKEAAKFDRDTIYELGLSGLEELKKLNPQFSVFEDTLFDITSRGFERSVESKEVNEKLDYHISNFLILLSPYFLLKPAHKALEWLINRYHIEEFNVDDILFLILPYHETILFARMVKLLPLKSDSGKWNWLYQVKKTGAPLSKRALLTRASFDMAFLKFVCNMPIEAIKVSGNKASSLGTLYAFYCTTVIGSLECANPIKELHVSHILPSLMSALGSSLPDFIASGYMIIARLVSKTCLGEKIFEGLLNKISKVDSVKMRSETSLVLVLLCQNNDIKYSFPEKAVSRLAKEKWFLTCLSTLSNNKILVIPLVLSMVKKGLQIILQGDDDGGDVQSFVQNILTTIHYDTSDAEAIFKCLLNGFNENINTDILKWYSVLLKELENIFPREFDKIASKILSEETKTAEAIKKLLGVTTSRNDLYQNLVHPNTSIRIAAIKNIEENYKPEQLAWLKGSLMERLKDDSHKVVNAILQLPKEFFIDNSSTGTLIDYLIKAIAKFGATRPSLLKQVANTIFTNINDMDPTLVLIILLNNPSIVDILRQYHISKASLPNSCKYFKDLQHYIIKSELDIENSKQILALSLWKSLKNSSLLPNCENIIETFNKFDSLKLYSGFWFSTTLLIANTLSENLKIDLVRQILDFLKGYLEFCKLHPHKEGIPLDENTFEQHLEIVHSNQLPIEGALNCMGIMTSKILLKKHKESNIWFNFNEEENLILLSMYRIINEGCKAKMKSIRTAFELHQKSFIQNHFPKEEIQINFIMNAMVYDEDLLDSGLPLISKLLHHYLPYYTTMQKDSPFFPSLLILLSSPIETVRNNVLSIIKQCSSFDTFYAPLATLLLSYSDEIQLDHEQLVVILYSNLTPSEEFKGLMDSTRYKLMQNILNNLILIITSADTPIYVKAKLLNTLEYVQSKELFLKLRHLAVDYVGKSKTLNGYESEIFCSIIKRLNISGSKCFDNDMWSLFENIIKDHTTQVIDSDTKKLTCPSAYLLKQISKDFFRTLTYPVLQNQERLISLILQYTTDIDKVEVINASTLFFKKIIIECKILVNLLNQMVNISSSKISPEKSDKPIRKRGVIPPSTEILGTAEWKQGVFLLELIQHKKKLVSMHLLIPTLFNILKKCLQFEQQSSVEYTKQLILSSLLHVCEHVDANSTSIFNDKTLHIDLIVDCVRSSHNPQTHHHALLALTYIAKLLPDQVLHNIMAIFTFIGSSVLRKDDVYSFQIITKIIDTIIPVLIKAENSDKDAETLSVAEIIRVFVAALLDVPEHRRIPLLVKLLTTLNASNYLWIFLCLVFESHVTRFSASSDIEIKDNIPQESNVPKKLQIAHQLCAEFQPDVILHTSHKLLVHLCSLPHEKDEKEIHKYKDKLNKFIFNIEKNTAKQFRHYKYTLLIFLSSLLSSNNFVQKLAELNQEEHLALESIFETIVKQNLYYIKNISKQVEECSNLPTAKYWKVVLNQSYDILDKTNALLPTEAFLRIIDSLLNSELDAVRRKAMELLGWRLQQPRAVPTETLIKLLPSLTQCLGSINFDETSSQDLQLNQQTALFALKLMARHLATIYPSKFVKILGKITNILCNEELPANWPVLGSLVLCVGEFASMLNVNSLVLLNKFLPAIISLLHKQSQHKKEDLLLLSIVTALQKIVDSLTPFLKPYLSEILYEVCILSAEYDNQMTTDTQKLNTLSQKLKLIRQKLSNEVPGRLLIPAANDCYSSLIKYEKHFSIGPLMSILSDSFTSSTDVTLEVTELLLTALDFRSNYNDNDKLDPNDINIIEDNVIAAFTHLVLKITESTFRPLYIKVYDWAFRCEGDRQRAITFFRLSSRIAVSLKSLFSLFAGIFIPNVSELLDKNNMTKEENETNWFDGKYSIEKSCILVDNILQTLLTIFKFDSHKFITKERFNKLMQPLIDQLENKLGGEDIWKIRCESLITPCVSQMSLSIIDDSLWKKLNYQILLKMRNNDAQIRLVAVRTVCSLASKLGEDFLPLLPETVPFLAELLEDDEEEVEKECQRVVNEMEEILGEPIQKYF